jgi:ATP-dependent exoDNAse (exonuclease V) beta subunit
VTRALSASAREVWESSGDLDADAVLRIEAARRLAKERGTLAHAMLESIEWIEDDAPPTAEALRRAALRAFPRADGTALDEAAAMVAHALAKPALRSWFERAGPRGEHGAWLRSITGEAARPIAVRREWRYARLAESEGGGLEQGSVDRLVLFGTGADRPTAALIVDFKTDRLPGPLDAGEVPGIGDTEPRIVPAPAAILGGRYAPQLAAYREAVCERFRLPTGAVGAVIISLAGGLALPLSFGA